MQQCGTVKLIVNILNYLGTKSQLSKKRRVLKKFSRKVLYSKINEVSEKLYQISGKVSGVKKQIESQSYSIELFRLNSNNLKTKNFAEDCRNIFVYNRRKIKMNH